MRTERSSGAPPLALTIVSLIVSAMSLSVGIASAEGLTPRAPIIIDGDAGFTAANGVVAGSGTASDPYIIENWSISAENANGIEIRNTAAYFVVRNCHVGEGGDLRDGIYLENVRNGRIDGVKSENNFTGINVSYSSNITIKDSIASNNLFGISVSDSSGNVIINCTASKNFWQGIFLSNSSGSIVANSKIEGNLVGVNPTNSENNQIYHNNFVNNEIQAYDEGANSWDDGYPSGGNYWSDYVGEDEDNDGIGDTPYVISGDNNRDRYPLMNPFVPPAQGPPDEGEAVADRWIVGAIGIISVLAAFYIIKMRLKRVKKHR